MKDDTWSTPYTELWISSPSLRPVPLLYYSWHQFSLWSKAIHVWPLTREVNRGVIARDSPLARQPAGTEESGRCMSHITCILLQYMYEKTPTSVLFCCKVFPHHVMKRSQAPSAVSAIASKRKKFVPPYSAPSLPPTASVHPTPSLAVRHDHVHDV